ncbi:NAD-dependent epimerase/dehydratase family protein [Cognatishimia activa]|uniref:dTDP-glucose 4,6-dehydratase n=1 Tax=Cognatishimia activa TaxID=1715691 RepID=A0A0P1IMP7_9RHOB|nr:NAD(P)-dependent oxidoreductase [Cognatishimia activa]CUI32949.1 dTDP-glucose 4,6-dehydratase [Cognatishimia activa]CUK24795.1 dTDP-glucose 4,6-dehydratase [Cognatishimia activa]
MTKVAVTGGSGGAGNAVIKHLVKHGYECVNLDINAPKEEHCPFIQVEVTDYKATLAAMEGCDAVVHFAGDPRPDADHWEGEHRFNNNTTCVFNVFQAAMQLGIKRVVWASSETIFGFPFEKNAPLSVPAYEDAPGTPQTAYAISKAASEDIAEMFAELYRMTFVGLRLSNVLYDDPDHPQNFQSIPGYWEDVNSRRFNTWGYIHSEDSAEAVRLSLETDLSGANVYTIAADDNIMNISTQDILDQVWPGLKVDPDLPRRVAFLNSDKAKRELGWEPKHTWASVLGRDPETGELL